MKFLAFFFMLATFATAAPVAISSSKHFRPSVQQSEHLKIKENMIATPDMVLYIVIHDTGLERGQILLRHDHIDVNLKDWWLEDILMLVAKGGHFPIADGFAVDGRRNVGNLKRPLYSARNHCIRMAIESRWNTTTIINTLWRRHREEGLVVSKTWQHQFQIAPVICKVGFSRHKYSLHIIEVHMGQSS